MNLYNYLKEEMTLNNIKDDLSKHVHIIQNQITLYLKVAETEQEHNDILSIIVEELEAMISIFNNIGFDYQPETTPDVSEDTFRDILNKFKEELSYFLNHFNNDILEPFNTQVRYILNLIEVHRTNFIQEDEILTESSINNFRGGKNMKTSLFESIQSNLKESENLEFFKTDGLNIALNVCIDNENTNTNCKEVSTEVVKAALDRGINCEVVEPMVIINGETASNNHYAILVGNTIVDYTIKQFLGDNETVDYFELSKSANDIFTMNSKDLKPTVVSELDGANLEEIYSISGKYDLIIELF